MRATTKRSGGRRIDWALKDLSPDRPLITIVTATFNAAHLLPWTIDSIRVQDYPNVQWIVADGGSTDDTVDMLNQNNDIIDVWFSEEDAGIYDAWNKALVYAKGGWIQFIGAGDELAGPSTLEDMAPFLAKAHPGHDLVYGRLQFLRESSRTVIREVGRPWNEMKNTWEFFRPALPAHPKIFHHRSLIDGDNTFDTRFKIAGDSHFLMKCIRKTNPLYVPVLIDRMPVGGVSERIENVYHMSKEVRLAAKELGFKPPVLHTCKEQLKLYGKRLLHASLPDSMVQKIAEAYRRITGKPLRGE